MSRICEASYARGVRLSNAGCSLPYLDALPGNGLRLFGDFGLMTAFNLYDGGSGFVLSVELRNLSVRRLRAENGFSRALKATSRRAFCLIRVREIPARGVSKLGKSDAKGALNTSAASRGTRTPSTPLTN